MSKPLWIFWLIASAVLIGVAGFSSRPPNRDESLHITASAHIWRGEGSFLSRLRHSDAPQGPLAFLLAGAGARRDGSGLILARILTALLGSLTLGLAMRLGASISGRENDGPWIIGAALLAMPYFLFVSTRFYTDAPALLGLLGSLHFWYRDRTLSSGLCLSAAVAARQNSVFACLGYFLYEIFWTKKDAGRRRALSLLLPPFLTAILLMLIWGGISPSGPYIDRMSPYLQPRASFINYYLSCAGLYLGWTLLLETNRRGFWKPFIGSLFLSPIFFLAIPGPNEYFIHRNIPIHHLGGFDRIITAAVGGGWTRSLVLFIAWQLGCLVFWKIVESRERSPWNRLILCWSAAFLLLHSAVCCAWEKYFLPLYIPLLLPLLSNTRDNRRAAEDEADTIK